jgi:ParB/RepB/Spo0J family partition protein
MKKMDTKMLHISEVRVAERIRKDNGGLEELANDIREHGLINPITVMEQSEGGYVLIAGLRRLKAMERMGAKEIRATVMTALEADEMLMLEIAENEQRKEFTVSEKLAFAEKLKAVEAEKAKQRQIRKSSNFVVANRPPQTKHAETGKARDIVAQKAGFTSTTQMRRAQAVSESRPDLMEQVDKGEKSISGAYSDMQRGTTGGEKPKADDGVLAGLIQEKPVEVPEFDVYRPASEPAPGNVRTVKGADHEHLLENPIYSRLYDSYNEAVQQANLVRGEMRTRCVGYERRIRGYEENIQTMRRTIETLRAENERLRTQLSGAAHA